MNVLKEKLFGAVEYYLAPRYLNTWGGPFNGQTFRQQMFLELMRAFDFSAIVETGTHRGTTTAYLDRSSNLPVHTVDVDPRFYGYSKARFLLRANVKTYHGDSRTFLRRILGKQTFIQQHVLFYLDAHWGDDLPLNEEIEIIFEHCPKAVVMVDDFRVPGDDEYGYDDYGEGKVLNLEYLRPVKIALQLAAFFPSRKATLESGARRGCVVLARIPDVIQRLKDVESLVPHTTSNERERDSAICAN